MPDLVNISPFPNFRYYASDNKGQEFGVIIVKGTYEIAPSGRLLLAEEQAPMLFDDHYHGAVDESSLWHPSDLVPHKPRTDIIVNAVARTLNSEPQKAWLCGVQVEKPDGTVIVSKALTVTGPRRWLPKWKRALSEEEKREWRKYREEFAGWELSEPQPISELPVHYEYAFGGPAQRGADEDGNPVIEYRPDNPLGCGWIDQTWTDHTKPQPAPQLELHTEPVNDPYKLYKPHSLGPIPPVWEPRLPLGGTYDDKWQKEVWPNWPADYSFLYNNSAPDDLICPRWLNGDEHIQLLGCFADQRIVKLVLPGEGVAVDFVRADESIEPKSMMLDTVFFDVAQPRRRDARIYLSWRVSFPPDQFEQAVLFHVFADKTAEGERQTIQKRKIA